MCTRIINLALNLVQEERSVELEADKLILMFDIITDDCFCVFN